MPMFLFFLLLLALILLVVLAIYDYLKERLLCSQQVQQGHAKRQEQLESEHDPNSKTEETQSLARPDPPPANPPS
jgi:hypothetical protein